MSRCRPDDAEPGGVVRVAALGFDLVKVSDDVVAPVVAHGGGAMVRLCVHLDRPLGDPSQPHTRTCGQVAGGQRQQCDSGQRGTAQLEEFPARQLCHLCSPDRRLYHARFGNQAPPAGDLPSRKLPRGYQVHDSPLLARVCSILGTLSSFREGLALLVETKRCKIALDRIRYPFSDPPPLRALPEGCAYGGWATGCGRKRRRLPCLERRMDDGL